MAPERARWKAKNAYYHRCVTEQVRSFVPPGASVLEVGCGIGDLLSDLQPSRGLGVDFSSAMIEEARLRYPHLSFVEADAEDLDLLGAETFDYVVLSDVLVYVQDLWRVFRSLKAVCHPTTRLIITNPSSLWEPAVALGTLLGRRQPTGQLSWLRFEDIENLLYLNHFEVVSSGSSVLLPVEVPLLSRFANVVLSQAPGLRALNLVTHVVARPTWQQTPPPRPKLKVSVIVPTLNERGNVQDIFARTPELGSGTELIFVDGHSDDGTLEEIRRLLPTRDAQLLLQDGKGKGDAVRKGFEAATGDVYMILDSDLTVPPEDLPKFYAAIAEGRGEFINGTRLVYPLEEDAMRFLNKIGNKFFGAALSWVLGQPLTDTLCGTKVLSAESYARIAAGRAFFGDFDPFGDFDLIFGAAKQQLRIVELPVRYLARTYGEIKISRFTHGWLLLRMTALAFRKFKLGRSPLG